MPARSARAPIGRFLSISATHTSQAQYAAIRLPPFRPEHLVVLAGADGMWLAVAAHRNTRRQLQVIFPSIALLADFAAAHGCSWVHLACGAEVLDELPVYPWTPATAPTGPLVRL